MGALASWSPPRSVGILDAVRPDRTDPLPTRNRLESMMSTLWKRCLDRFLKSLSPHLGEGKVVIPSKTVIPSKAVIQSEFVILSKAKDLCPLSPTGRKGRVKRFSSALFIAVSILLISPLASAMAQIDPDAGDEAPAMTGARILSHTLDPDVGDEAPAPQPGGQVAADAAAECDTIGVFANPFSGTNRYRGNVYRFEFPAKLKVIKMELAFSGTTDLHVAIHRKEANGEYKRYPEGSSDMVILGADGGTGLPKFYTTGDLLLDDPVDLIAGFDYAIGFAWGSKTITYGRDAQGYPVPFRAGEILGLVAAGPLPPPPDPLVPETFPEFIIFDSGAYSMQLCFEPVPGACCRADLGDCKEVLKTDCVGAGSFFHGEYIRCAETPCIFGTCCDPCDGCLDDPYTPEACALNRPDRHWTAFDCPVDDPELLCPIVTGACCRGTTCTQECRHNCENPPSPTAPGTYRGDGTDCTPNECPGAVGACCVSGGCLNVTLASCTSSNGTYKGPGTACLTLPPELECGGACCGGFDISNLEFCRHVASRSECSLAPKGGGFPYSAYRGDGTTCPSNCNDRTEVACCLPNGTCINTTSGFCQVTWVKGVPHPGEVCEDQPTLCPSRISCCFPDGRCELMTPSGCTAFSGSAGAGTMCAADACESFVPTGVCCGNTLGQCAVMSEAQCNAQGDLYQGDGTDCITPGTACPGFGACCFSNGDCLDDVSLDQCTSLGGEYQNDNTFCDAPTIDCDLRGACCAITGTCLFITQEQCNDIDPTPGVFRGMGVACTANTCPGACCLTTGCEPRTPADCLASDGSYQEVDLVCQTNLCVFGACCNGDTCSNQTRHTCERDGGAYLGDGVVCAANVCAPGACCKGDTCSPLHAPLCAQQDGVFLGDGVACAPDTCPAGACCLATGCEVQTELSCTGSGGVFQGIDVACEPNLCIVGACCNGDTCTSRTRHTCERDGGTYLGDASACDVDTCTLGACCDGIACSDVIRFSCEDVGHVFKGPGTACADPNPCPCTDHAQCDDGNSCTDDSCDLVTGCAHVDNTASCDDGDACTTDDACSAGACAGGPVLDCDDGDDCTNDRCVNGSCVNDEYAAFVLCLGGPDQTIPPECACFDLNTDNHVDLLDVSLFFLAFQSP